MPPSARRTRVAVVLALLMLPAVLGLAAPADTAVLSGDTAVADTAVLPAETPPSARNVVLFMADDMRADDLVFMPRLRRLVAATGVRFENAFSPYPLCCPARASFLTGLAAHNHHVYWHTAPYGFGALDDSVTIATAMKAAGYRTGFVGKYLNGYGTQRSRVTGGPSVRYVPAGWDDWRGAVSRPRGAHWTGGPYNLFNTAYNVNGRIDAGHRGEYQTDGIGVMTRQMLARFHRSSRPFFVYTSVVAPHHAGPHERDDPPRHVRRDDGRLSDMPTTARPRWVRGHFDRLIRRASGIPAGGRPTEADVSDKPWGVFRAPEPNRTERAVLREVTRQRAEALYVLDREVGRTVAHLKRLGEWRDTVFMFTSDNGYYLGEHRKRSGKVTAHEPSLRVPLLMTGPGIAAGERRYDPVTTMDLTATVADLGGATAKFGYRLDGVSVLPVARGADQGWSRPVVTEALYGGTDGRLRTWTVKGFPSFTDPRGSIGLRLGRFKITVYRNGFVELYDLAVDPNELRGVQRDPGYQAVRAEMLRLWWQYKDCRAGACTEPVSEDLQLLPAANARITEGMTAARVARYGR